MLNPCYIFPSAPRLKFCLCRYVIALLFTISMVEVAFGQSPDSTEPAASVPDASATVRAAAVKDKIKRWFEFDQLTVATRYHFIENDNNAKAANNDQYQFIAKFRVKLDKNAKYSFIANF